MRRRVRLADGAVTLSDAPAPAELEVNDTELVNCFGPVPHAVDEPATNRVPGHDGDFQRICG